MQGLLQTYGNASSNRRCLSPQNKFSLGKMSWPTKPGEGKHAAVTPHCDSTGFGNPFIHPFKDTHWILTSVTQLAPAEQRHQSPPGCSDTSMCICMYLTGLTSTQSLHILRRKQSARKIQKKESIRITFQRSQEIIYFLAKRNSNKIILKFAYPRKFMVKIFFNCNDKIAWHILNVGLLIFKFRQSVYILMVFSSVSLGLILGLCLDASVLKKIIFFCFQIPKHTDVTTIGS